MSRLGTTGSPASSARCTLPAEEADVQGVSGGLNLRGLHGRGVVVAEPVAAKGAQDALTCEQGGSVRELKWRSFYAMSAAS